VEAMGTGLVASVVDSSMLTAGSLEGGALFDLFSPKILGLMNRIYLSSFLSFCSTYLLV